MITVDIKGTLGKFGYSNIPEALMLDVLNIAVSAAYRTAVLNAPYDTTPDGIHLREDLKFELATIDNPIGIVSIKSPYANVTEKGSRHRIAHPFMKPAAKAAKNKMRAVIRKAFKEAVYDEMNRMKPEA